LKRFPFFYIQIQARRGGRLGEIIGDGPDDFVGWLGLACVVAP